MNQTDTGIAALPIRESRTKKGSLELSNSEVVVYLGLLMFIVIALSVFIFSRQSLRLDEAQSLWQTSHGIESMLSIVAQDVHVPLYHYLLHFWQFLFGNGVVAGRMLSLIFFLGMIPAVYALANEAYGRTAGLFSATLMAISPFLNWYGNEIRMYSIFALLVILNQFFFIKILNHGREGSTPSRGTWIGYAVTFILGMFTHYFFAFNVITQAIFFLIYRKQFPKNAILYFLFICLVAAMLFMPWLYYVYNLGAASNTQPLLSSPSSVDVFNTFSQFVFGFQDDRTNTILVSMWPLLVLLIFMALRRHQKITPATMFLFFGLIVPIFLTFVISSEFKPIYLTRYLILSLPSMYILISWFFSQYPEKLSRLFKFGLVILMVVTMGIEIVNASTPVKENYREAVSYLSQKATVEDIIVVSAPFTVYPVEYYYHGPAAIQTLPTWDRFASGPIPPFNESTLPAEIAMLKGSHQTMWIILSYDQGYESKIREYMDTHFERVDARQFSPGLTLFAYRLRYDNPNAQAIINATLLVIDNC